MPENDTQKAIEKIETTLNSLDENVDKKFNEFSKDLMDSDFVGIVTNSNAKIINALDNKLKDVVQLVEVTAESDEQINEQISDGFVDNQNNINKGQEESKKMFEGLFDNQNNINKGQEEYKKMFDGLFGTIGNFFTTGISEKLTEVLSKFIPYKNILDFITSPIGIASIMMIVSFIKNRLYDPFIKPVFDMFRENVWPWLKKAGKLYWDFTKWFYGTLFEGFKYIWDGVKYVFSGQMLTDIKAWWSLTMDNLKFFFTESFTNIKNWFGAKLDTVQKFFAEKTQAIGNWFKEKSDSVKNWISTKWDNLTNFFNKWVVNPIKMITTHIKGMMDVLKNIGGIIGFTVLNKILISVNNLIAGLKNFEIFKKKPFANIPVIPLIPQPTLSSEAKNILNGVSNMVIPIVKSASQNEFVQDAMNTNVGQFAMKNFDKAKESVNDNVFKELNRQRELDDKKREQERQTLYKKISEQGRFSETTIQNINNSRVTPVQMNIGRPKLSESSVLLTT